MPPRFGHPLPTPSLDELVKEERDKIRKRAAEQEAKAASPGGAGPALRCKAGHPMMIRPGGPNTGTEYNGSGGGIMGSTSLTPGRTLSSQPRAPSFSPMLSLGSSGYPSVFLQSGSASSSTSRAPSSSTPSSLACSSTKLVATISTD